jgi:hypothetical protein
MNHIHRILIEKYLGNIGNWGKQSGSRTYLAPFRSPRNAPLIHPHRIRTYEHAAGKEEAGLEHRLD